MFPGLEMENFGLLKPKPFEVPYLKEFKFYDVGFTGYKGDEDKHYAKEP